MTTGPPPVAMPFPGLGDEPGPAFAPGSRYELLEIATFDGPNGDLRYVRRRFIPQRDEFVVLEVHVVAGGDRVDTVAAARFGDGRLFWRVADPNLVMRPTELVEEIGRRLGVTLPAGIPGPNDA